MTQPWTCVSLSNFYLISAFFNGAGQPTSQRDTMLIIMQSIDMFWHHCSYRTPAETSKTYTPIPMLQ